MRALGWKALTERRSRSSSRAPEARNGSDSSEIKKARDTRLGSRSSSRAQAARNSSDSSKAQTKAKDTEKFSKPSSASGANGDDGKHRATKKKHSKSEGLGPVPTFRHYPFTIDDSPDNDETPSGTCNQRYKLVPLKSHDIKNQRDVGYPCIACMWHTNLVQASMCCPKGCNGEFKAFICTECHFETVPSTAIAIACMKKDSAKREMVAVPKVVGDDEEIKVPMRLR